MGLGTPLTGGRARQLMDHLPEQAQIVAICDVYRHRAEEANQLKKAAWPIYADYRELLERPDVDAVVVATPDHGRVLPCIHACQAGNREASRSHYDQLAVIGKSTKAQQRAD